MKRQSVVFISIFIPVGLLVLAFLLWFFLRPRVLWVEPGIAEVYTKELRPSFWTHSLYSLKFVNESDAELVASRGDYDLIIFTPLSRKFFDTNTKTALWGREPEEGEEFTLIYRIDPVSLYREALEDNKGINTAFVYREGDASGAEILEALKEEDTYLIGITYPGRVSEATATEVYQRLSDEKVVSMILYTPSSSLYLARSPEGMRSYVDWRYYAALKNTKAKAIGPRWSMAFHDAMKSPDGVVEIPLEFTVY